MNDFWWWLIGVFVAIVFGISATVVIYFLYDKILTWWKKRKMPPIDELRPQKNINEKEVLENERNKNSSRARQFEKLRRFAEREPGVDSGVDNTELKGPAERGLSVQDRVVELSEQIKSNPGKISAARPEQDNGKIDWSE